MVRVFSKRNLSFQFIKVCINALIKSEKIHAEQFDCMIFLLMQSYLPLSEKSAHLHKIIINTSNTSYKIRNGEMIQLVKVAKIKEGDIKHKYVCGGGGG